MTHGSVTLVWQGGRQEFCLSKIDHVLALEDKCKAGIATIAMRLQSGAWYLNDVREPIRLGLIGTGLTPAEAEKQCGLHVDSQPFIKSALIAYSIIEAVLAGVPDDPIVDKKDDVAGKTPADRTPGATSSTPTEDFADPPLSRSAPVSASTHEQPAA